MAKPTLTPEDWMEIYYALDTKVDSAIVGDDLRWNAHLREIMEKIGVDGTDMWEEE